jgi:hypothetical protein
MRFCYIGHFIYKYTFQLEPIVRFCLQPIKHPWRNQSLSYASANDRESTISIDVEGFLEKYPMRYRNRPTLPIDVPWFDYSLNPFTGYFYALVYKLLSGENNHLLGG